MILSFKQWVSQNPSISNDLRVTKYDEYLKSVILDNIPDKEDDNTITVDLFKSFLKRITVIYNDDPEIKKLNNLDLDDPKQLLSAIPIFVDKIKDIAEFYTRKRKAIKANKVKLSIKGSEQSLCSVITNLFFDKFSIDDDYQNPTIADLDLLNNISNKRDELITNLEVGVVEKYNTTSQTPNL